MSKSPYYRSCNGRVHRYLCNGFVHAVHACFKYLFTAPNEIFNSLAIAL